MDSLRGWSNDRPSSRRSGPSPADVIGLYADHSIPRNMPWCFAWTRKRPYEETLDRSGGSGSAPVAWQGGVRHGFERVRSVTALSRSTPRSTLRPARFMARPPLAIPVRSSVAFLTDISGQAARGLRQTRHIILDNLSAHKTRSAFTRIPLDTHPNVTLHFDPYLLLLAQPASRTVVLED